MPGEACFFVFSSAVALRFLVLCAGSVTFCRVHFFFALNFSLSFYWFFNLCSFFSSFSISMLAVPLYVLYDSSDVLCSPQRRSDAPLGSFAVLTSIRKTHAHSGLLVTLLFLRTQKPSKAKRDVDFVAGTKQTFMLIIYRYIRLTPVYFMVIVINAVTLKWVLVLCSCCRNFCCCCCCCSSRCMASHSTPCIMWMRQFVEDLLSGFTHYTEMCTWLVPWPPPKESHHTNSWSFPLLLGSCFSSSFISPQCADTCTMEPYSRPACPITSHARNIGGTTYCTSKRCSRRNNCACFGRGIWPMTCSSMYGPSHCLSSPSGKYLCVLFWVSPPSSHFCLCVCVAINHRLTCDIFAAADETCFIILCLRFFGSRCTINFVYEIHSDHVDAMGSAKIPFTAATRSREHFHKFMLINFSSMAYFAWLRLSATISIAKWLLTLLGPPVHPYGLSLPTRAHVPEQQPPESSGYRYNNIPVHVMDCIGANIIKVQLYA